MQEESGESVNIDSSRVAEWLCPLCQQGQPDRSSLSLHLTGQHNVLPNCVDKLLDIAVPKQCASGEVKDTDAHNTTEAALQQMKHGEDSKPCQTEENSHAVQQPKDKVMEEEVCGQGAAEQGAGGAQPESQQEGNQPTGEATQRNTTENAEMAEASAASADKNGVVPPKVTRSFKCTACQEAFLSKTALSVHYSSDTHIQQMKTGGETDQTVTIPVLTRPFLSNKPYQCAVCRVSYNHAITLESHMKSVLHQTRSRNAGNAANSTAATGVSGSSSNSAPSPEVGTPGCGASQLVTTTNRPAPGSLMVTAKDAEQIPVSAAAPSLLASPVASAQAVSAFLTLLTSSPSSVSHSLLPSLFAAGTAPGVATPQLVPQPQMLMPLILNGLQAQQSQENQPGHLLTQCVPLLGLSPAQQALVAQRLNSLQNQGPAVGVQANTQSCEEEQKGEDRKSEEECVKQEDKTVKEENKMVKEENKIVKKEVKVEDRDSLPVVGVKRERGEEEETKELISKMIKLEKDGEEGKMEGADGDGTTDGGDSLTDQSGLDGGDKAAILTTSPIATEKSFRNNNLSPSTSVRSNSSLSPVHLNLTLSPDSTPQKSQAGTSPCGSVDSLKTSPYKSTSFSPDHTRPRHNTKGHYVSPGPPVLSEFQSEVLSAFFESRSEADAASPPREDCEALGREVGLTEDEVRRWLCQARNVKVRQRAMGSEHSQDRAGLATQVEVDGLDNDFDEDESSLIIAESEDGAEASSSQAIDLSSSRRKRKERAVGRNNQGDACLTSDSETEEVYTSVIVSDDESQNGSLRERPDSPAKEEAQRQPAGNKGPSGGKVLRSTTVFLSDAEDEYEEEDGGGGQRANLKKRKREFEREEVEVKKERQDPDVDLELEAQGDPPSTQVHSMDHTGLPSGMLHSLPLSLSLAPFSAQFLSPYVLSLPPSIMGDKLPTFSNPPNITRFAEPLITQSLSSHGQISHYLSNGGDCESALDLSIGKRSNSKSTSSSSSSSMIDRTLLQKGRLLDGLGLRPTSKGLVVVQVKPEGSTTTASNSNTSLVNCNNLNKSSIYMRAAEKMNATLLEREREREKEKEQQQRRSKGRRYRDMRRSRTIIQAEQLDILYGCYFKDPNPGKHEFEQISEWVHLPKKVVQIWFQNMRARERKGEVRFISDGTLAALGKPLIKFTWPLSKPIFSNKPTTTNSSPGSITTTPVVRTLIKTEKEPVEMGKLPDVVKNVTPVPIKPREVVSSSTVSPVSCVASSVPKIKLETTSNLTMVKIAPKMNTPILLAPPKELFPIAPRPVLKLRLEEESEEDKTDEEKDSEKEMRPVPGATNRMVPKIPTTPINNKPPTTATVQQQKQNGINYWTPKGSFKINTLSREQLALPMHNAPSRTIPPPPTPSIAPVSPNIPSKVASPATPAVVKSSPTENSFLPHSCSRRPRTHLSCLQLSILQSCYETCAHPNAMECEAIGTELSLPLKVVQIWFQNTRAKEKRWRLQQEKMSPVSGGKVDMSSGSYLQYNALRANRPILPKPVQLTVIESVVPSAAGQQTPKETLTGRCEVCNITFESRAAARSHVFSPRHLATLRTTNFGQPATLVSKNGTSSSGGPGGTVPGSQVTLSSPVSSSGGGSGAETIIESPPSPATTSSS